MFGPGRGRTTSLLDIPGTSASHFTGEGPHDGQAITGGPCNTSKSIPDLSLDADFEYGVGLLVSGSPIGDNADCNDSLLDYDSDNPAASHHGVQQDSTGQLTMETDVDTTREHAATSAVTKNSVVTDAMYHQCRNSRLNDRRDNLVSVLIQLLVNKLLRRQYRWVPLRTTRDWKKLFTVLVCLRVPLLLTSP
jgi:hypothetical protein